MRTTVRLVKQPLGFLRTIHFDLSHCSPELVKIRLGDFRFEVLYIMSPQILVVM